MGMCTILCMSVYTHSTAGHVVTTWIIIEKDMVMRLHSI